MLLTHTHTHPQAPHLFQAHASLPHARTYTHNAYVFCVCVCALARTCAWCRRPLSSHTQPTLDAAHTHKCVRARARMLFSFTLLRYALLSSVLIQPRLPATNHFSTTSGGAALLVSKSTHAHRSRLGRPLLSLTLPSAARAAFSLCASLSPSAPLLFFHLSVPLDTVKTHGAWVFSFTTPE